MRTFNSRLFAVLLAGGVVFGTGVYFLHAFQVRRNAHVFWQAAQRAKERAERAKGEDEAQDEQQAFVEAIRNFGFYLTLRPDDLDALEEYGLFLADRGRYGPAFAILEKLLRQAPDRTHIRRKVVGFAMQLGEVYGSHPDAAERARQSARWIAVAREHLDNFLLKESPNDAELLVLLGRCQAFFGDSSKAAESFRRAIKSAPTLVDAYPRLAAVLRHRLNRPKEADQCIEDLAQANPDAWKAHLMAGTYWKDVGASEEALHEALKSLKLKPEERDTLLLAAQVAAEMAGNLNAQQQCEAAQGYYYSARDYGNRALKLYPDQAAVYTTLANIHLRSGEPDEAVAFLQAGVKATENEPQMVWNAVNLLIDTGRIQEAEQSIEQMRDAQFVPALIAYVQARMEYVQGHWRTAIDGFEKVRSGLSPWPAMIPQVDLAMGRCYGKLGNPEQEQKALRRALDVDPTFSQARLALTESLINAGKLDEALGQYQQAVKIGQALPGGGLPLIRLLILRNLSLPRPQQNWQQVETLLERAAQANPDAVEVAALRAEVAMARDRPESAERLLLEARSRNPENPGAWTALLLLAQRQQQWDKAEKLGDEARQKLGDQVELRLAQASYLVARYAAEAAPKLRDLAEKIESFSAEERLQLWKGLLNSAVRADDAELTQRLCSRVAEKEPSNVQIRFVLFEIALRAEDLGAVEKALEEIRKIEGDGPIWHYCEAARLTMLAKKGDAQRVLNQALQHLAQARAARPTWSRVPLLEAGIYDQQGKQDLAMVNYRKAVDLGDRNAAAIGRLVTLYRQRNRYDEADQMLGLLAGREMPSGGDWDRQQSLIKWQIRDPAAALKIARKAAANSQDFKDHIWLAQLLELSARSANAAAGAPQAQQAEKLLQEAEQSLRRAVELSDKTPVTWISLIKFLAGTGQMRRAEEELEKCRNKIPADQVPLVLAQGYELLGQAGQAREKYEEALANGGTDPLVVRTVADYYWRTGKPQPAEVQLQRLLDGKIPGAQQSDILWARRVQALIWASHANYPDLQKALQLVEQNLALDASSVYDQRLKASILAALPSRDQRNQAEDVFEELISKWPGATAEDKLALAELYRTHGEWTKFTNQMRNLVAEYPDNPRYLTIFVDALLEHNEIQSAETYLGQLEEKAPEQYAASRLRAEILFRQGKHEEAVQLLKSFLKKPGGVPTDPATRLRLVGETLELFSRRLTEPTLQPWANSCRRDAEMMLRTYVGQRPGQELLLVAFYIRQGQIGEALDELERVWAISHPTAVAKLLIDLLRSEAASQDDFHRGEAIVRAALKKSDRPMPMLLVMADVCTNQQRYADAEKFYREIIERNPRDTVAKNNLALLLALQGKRLDEALALVNKAIELAGPMGAMLDSRASVYMALGQPDKAMADLKAAIADAESPIRLFHRAQAYNMLGDKRAAARDLKDARKAGLKPESLQPLERALYQQLQKLLQ
jgi:tetratricopeptide (TPR) repeat protein